jgi:hypothetical protein
MNKYLILLLLYYACWPEGTDETPPYHVKDNLLACVAQYTRTAVYHQDQLTDCRENRLFYRLLNKKD